METKSRTEYSAHNTTVAMFSRAFAIVMGYVLRIVFTHTLSASYVGINGLFMDILNILSLSEMGLETAISYALYRPIADNDIEKQKSVMRLFRRFYNTVAVVVFGLGLLVIPFMDVLVKNQQEVGHITFIYILYLVNTSLSYMLVYKKTMMDAHQLMYIGTVYKTTSWAVQDVVQIIFLVTTHNFYIYLFVNIATTLISNILISKKADSLYPFLREHDAKPLPKEEMGANFRNIRAMLMHRLGNVAVNNTDNLILSSVVGIMSVGCYSNYYLVIASVQQVLTGCFQGITASVGNLSVTSDAKKVREVFKSVFFVTHWLYTFAAICLFELLNPFVELSFGKQYVFAEEIVLVLCINFFLTGMRKAALVFRDSIGLFWFDRHNAVITAVLNLVISIILAKRLGTIGVFMGTTISMLMTTIWVEPYVLYKHHFKAPVSEYFIRYAAYVIEAAAVWFVTDMICSHITGGCIYEIIVRGIICVIVPNIIICVIHYRTPEFGFVAGKIKQLVEKRIHG